MPDAVTFPTYIRLRSTSASMTVIVSDVDEKGLFVEPTHIVSSSLELVYQNEMPLDPESKAKMKVAFSRGARATHLQRVRSIAPKRIPRSPDPRKP